MVDSELKSILLKSGSENLYGQIIVVQSKKGNRKIKQFNEYIKNSLIMDFFSFIMDFFSFKLTFEEIISGHITKGVNTNKNAILKQKIRLFGC